jgi:2-hydroxychromene-2-carboxylate isomerase
MAEDRVKFYFAYNSPYAFLANSRLVGALAPTGVAIEYKPVCKPRPGGDPDFKSPRVRYIIEDIGRFARAYGISLEPGPFTDTAMACRGFLFAAEAGQGLAFHDRVFEARWLKKADIGDASVLADIAAAVGLDAAAFAAATEPDSPYDAALERGNAEAEADGVFGFPFFVYRGQRFWGNDRIEWLVEEIDRAAD